MPCTLLHNVDPLNSCQKFLKKYLKYVQNRTFGILQNHLNHVEDC